MSKGPDSRCGNVAEITILEQPQIAHRESNSHGVVACSPATIHSILEQAQIAHRESNHHGVEACSSNTGSIPDCTPLRCSSLNQEEARSYPVYRPTALASAKSQRPTCQACQVPQGPPLIHLTKCPYEQPVKGISTNSGWSARNRRCHSAFTRRSTGHSPQTGSCSRQKGTDLDRRHLHFSWPRCRTSSKYPGLPCGSTWLPP